jgi:deoxyribodipyrimidine photolyase-like uncharacterized protein
MDSCEAYISKRLHEVKQYLIAYDIVVDIRSNQQFLIDTKTFNEKYSKPPVMETFYRWMRKQTRMLME